MRIWYNPRVVVPANGRDVLAVIKGNSKYEIDNPEDIYYCDVYYKNENGRWYHSDPDYRDIKLLCFRVIEWTELDGED